MVFDDRTMAACVLLELSSIASVRLSSRPKETPLGSVRHQLLPTDRLHLHSESDCMAAFTVDVGLSTLSFNMPEAKGATIRVAGRFSPVPSRIDCANLRTIHIQNNALKWVGKLVLTNLHNLEPITVDKFSLMKAGIYFSGLWLEASFTVDDENQVFAVRRADNRKWKLSPSFYINDCKTKITLREKMKTDPFCRRMEPFCEYMSLFYSRTQ